MIPVIPMAITAGSGLGYAIFKMHGFSRLKGVLTPVRERIYHEALNSLRAASDLRALAIAFRGERLFEEADLLDKRASIKELPEKIRKARRAVVKEALTWKDPEKVNRLAKVFDDVGANGAAALLRRYAAGLLPSDKSDTIPAPAVRRRRQNKESDMSNINPFPQAPIPGALNPNPPATPNPGAVPTPAYTPENPAETPATPESAGEPLPPIDPDTGKTPDINPDDPNVNLTVEESSDPSEPTQVTVETDDPEHTDVQVTETDD